MSVLYIREQGSCLSKRGERLIVTKNRSELLDIPVMGVENVALFGNVQITAPMLQFLMKKGIDVSYFTYGGSYLGHTAAESSRNIFVRFAQYERYQDIARRQELARCIVENKVQNQMTLIRKHRWEPEEEEWKQDVAQMAEYLCRLPRMETSNQILGIEGICSQIYFKSFGRMLKSSIRFSGRNRRPPKDPVNVLLSLGYTFLTREVSAALEAESFEMYLGFLHGIRYGRKSLALDLVEELRQPVIDRLVIRLFNKQMFTEADFDMEEEAVVLAEDGFRKFCKEYEKWMTDKSFSDGTKAFRSVLKEQAHLLKCAIQNREDYVPYRWGVWQESLTEPGGEKDGEPVETTHMGTGRHTESGQQDGEGQEVPGQSDNIIQDHQTDNEIQGE